MKSTDTPIQSDYFAKEKKEYGITAKFESNFPSGVIVQRLRDLGFYHIDLEERGWAKPDKIKKTNMGRPLKYSEKHMGDVVNRNGTDSELASRLDMTEHTVRNMRSIWRRRYPELLR